MSAEPADPEAAPRFRRFRIVYPSGTVIEGYYHDGAPLREVQVAHPLAVVEVVEESFIPWTKPGAVC